MISVNLKNSIIWITGSGQGIGKAIAMNLAKNGARVVMTSRSLEKLAETAKEIQDAGGEVLALPGDVRDVAQIESIVNQVESEWGGIDVLINNAGVGIFKKITKLEESDWNDMMDANAKSAFLCSRAVLPGMMDRQRGHIVNIVSVAARKAFPNNAGYSASKYAMLGFTDVLRLEARDHGIKVTAVLPGATDTPLWGDANIDHSKMMQPKAVAESIVGLLGNTSNAMIEELVIRPQGGDL